VLRDIKIPRNGTVTLIGYPGEIKRKIKGRNLEIELPNLSDEERPCRDAFTFKIPGAELLPEE